MSKTPVTVLGLGRMGAAVAEILVRAGHPTTVWNRTPGRAAHLDALGARRAPDPRTAVAAGRLIITVLADTPAATELLTPLADALAGRTVLNVATGRPDQAAELTTRLGGIPVLDAGIFGVPQTLGTSDTLLVYSGSPAANTEFGGGEVGPAQGALYARPAEYAARLYLFLAGDRAADVSGMVFVAAGGFVGRFEGPTPAVLG
ncbi:NAD(P)-binding domain-containing protein, partial [Nocardia farcinica]|uniref:NAD(P)-binding domain-containing protein n=1 Tax=Nocardia farcinica TaxID=37329 RepID=UPI0024580E07